PLEPGGLGQPRGSWFRWNSRGPLAGGPVSLPRPRSCSRRHPRGHTPPALAPAAPGLSLCGRRFGWVASAALAAQARARRFNGGGDFMLLDHNKFVVKSQTKGLSSKKSFEILDGDSGQLLGTATDTTGFLPSLFGATVIEVRDASANTPV